MEHQDEDDILPKGGEPGDHSEREQKSVQRLYGALCAAVILQFVPLVVSQIIGTVFLSVVLIWAYVARRGAETESLRHNHATYIIRTIWLWSLLFAIGLVAFAIWFVSFMWAPLENVMLGGETDTQALMQSLVNENMRQFSVMGMATLGPSILYIAYRIGKGLTRALKGYRLANPKAVL